LISNKQLGITDTRSGATPASVRPWGAVGLCGREGKNGGREGKTDFFSEAGVHDTRRDRPASVAGVASPAPFNRHLAAPNLYYLEILVMLRWELNSMSSLRSDIANWPSPRKTGPTRTCSLSSQMNAIGGFFARLNRLRGHTPTRGLSAPDQ